MFYQIRGETGEGEGLCALCCQISLGNHTQSSPRVSQFILVSIGLENFFSEKLV